MNTTPQHSQSQTLASKAITDVSLKPLPFNNPYNHGFVRVAAGIPRVHLVEPMENAQEILALLTQADAEQAALLTCPELALSGYAIDDLLHQSTLQTQVETAIAHISVASAKTSTVILFGAPLRVQDALYNCAIVMQSGRILGVVPKSYLPNYREFYEKRHFIPAATVENQTIELIGQQVRFGHQLIFSCQNIADFTFGVEICEDVWTPIPPSTYACMAGARIIANLSSSSATIGKAAYRRSLAQSQSGRTMCAYIYTAAGLGESTTDLAWDGDAFIVENGQLLAENQRYQHEPSLIYTDVDVQRLTQERMRMNSYHDNAQMHRAQWQSYERIPFAYYPQSQKRALARKIARFPFVPDDPSARDARCEEAYQIQVQGLMQRLLASGIEKIVIGVSGGLDSTQALLVAARTMDALGLPREHILAYTMPGYATSDSTKDNAWALMRALGVTAKEIDIRPSCLQMLKDLNHPFADGEPVYDVTFENVQAGERTSHLFRLANHLGAMVLGTGDLSELALGWCTYGVGDQMSHYNVNASVPKTLIRHLLRWEQTQGVFDASVDAVLQRIIDTEISPELVPGDEAGNDQPAQHTEAVIGPYPLQDFHLYYLTRFGFDPTKVAYLAAQAWQDQSAGEWPEGTPADERVDYDLRTIKRWLRVFIHRFYQTSQFKRSAMPNGPKVGSGGSLSPRGDWRAPSDASAKIWLAALDSVPNRL